MSNSQKLLSKKIHNGEIDEMCSLSDGRVFTASDDGTVKVLGPSLEILNQIEESKRAIYAIGNYGNKVATGDDEGTIRYYDLNEECQPQVSES